MKEMYWWRRQYRSAVRRGFRMTGRWDYWFFPRAVQRVMEAADRRRHQRVVFRVLP